LGYSEGNNSIKEEYSDTYAFSLEMRSSASDRDIKLLLQGSYANKTNVKQESDVDIALLKRIHLKQNILLVQVILHIIL
jgi:tRNA nucleotidyltransferase (CCA-adding enzyme)